MHNDLVGTVNMLFQPALTWLRNLVADIAQDFLLTVLAAGPIPKHVAFILDGNRRYARSRQKRVIDGHSAGYLVFRSMFDVCLRLGITCVSAYVFSILNFDRPQEEVDALMTMAEERLTELSQDGGLLDQYGIRLNIVGRMELLPESLQKVARRAEYMSRNNTRAILNLCVSYTSRDEITTAVQTCVRNAIKSGANRNSIITEDDINSQLQISQVGSPPVDILIRTGGAKRLSDFLLWQCCENTQIHLLRPFWPEFGFFDIIPIILDYQIKVWKR